MDVIVRDARTSLRWLHQNLATLGGDPARLYVSGWSAGAHLAVLLMDEPLVAGGLAISGLFTAGRMLQPHAREAGFFGAEHGRGR
jgi:arylformamidase